MKRNGGLVAGLLVVLAFFGVSNLPKSSEASRPAEPGKPTAPSPKAARGSTRPVYSACSEIADRLRRYVEPGDWTLPKSCYEPDKAPAPAPKGPQALPQARFAIATVPNPVSTHLPLLFDRTVESIQQAAQDESYSYDDSWFPWEAAAKDYALLGDQQAAEELRKIQQDQPGVMVFRQGLVQETDGRPYDRGLIVFLVGEKPTGGISDSQFHNALAWIARLGGISNAQPLRILGPTFSGSLPSLWRALENDLTADQLEGYKSEPTIHVSSGTVSSGVGTQWFASWIATRKEGSYFRTALENDSVMTDRFCQYLKDQGYDPRKVAFLSEDETAFGFETEKQSPCREAIQLYYPRDIATLRSAYQQQSILGAAKSQSNANAPSTTLRGDLSEPSGSDHDTVRSYGGQLTPLAQESVLLDIARRLSERQSQFIILRSTSSLDQIFLGEFLRRSYPEGRVVIDGADLLFTRGTEGRSLHGVMLLSTYPLLTMEQDWTPSLPVPRTESRTFGEDKSEGVYIAGRELFHEAAGPNDNPAENAGPATWLTVVGHRQFWPLAVFQPSAAPGDGLPRDDAAPGPLSIPTTMWLFAIACVAWSLLHLSFCWKRAVIGSPHGRAYFTPVDWPQHPALIAFGSLLPAMLAITVAAAAGLFSGTRVYRYYEAILLAALVVTILVVSLIACVKNYRLSPKDLSWQLKAGWAAGVGLALYTAGHIVLIHKLSPANSIPAYWRAVNLLSGVSPLVPQLLLIAGGYLWFWCTLRGLAHFGGDRPVLPKEDDLPKLDGKPLMPMFSRENGGEDVENAARPLTRRYLKLVGIAFAAGAGVWGIALEGPSVRTLGERAFGVLIFVWISLSTAVIIADGIELWRAWSELRQLLVSLDRLPLRRTLRALKGLAWGSIWKLSGNVLEERYRVISLQVESLRHLKNTVAEWKPDGESIEAKLAVLHQVSKCEGKIAAVARWYVSLQGKAEEVTPLSEFQEELASTAGVLMEHILRPAWRKEKESLIFDRSSPERKPGEDGGTETVIATQKLAAHVQAAEEFFVLPYLAFIQNILGRLRTTALGSLWLFLCVTFAVSSYPFDPLNVLGGIFFTVFAIVGGVTVLAYSQMCRDATLSHITNTRPGELGTDFWVRLVTFGVGPLIGLLTTLFPSITDFVFSWLQPGVQALK